MSTPQHHGHADIRGVGHLRSTLTQGRFGRLFRNLPAYGWRRDDAFSTALKELTREGGPLTDTRAEQRTRWSGRDPEDPGESDRLHAGLTYFGQLIDHEVTFDPTSKLDRDNDPDALHSFRTPRLELDSLYGAGPEASPHLYDPQTPGRLALARRNPAGKLLEADAEQARAHADLPRAEGSQLALTGDPRNDENRILSQLHLAMIEFHNAVLEQVEGDFEEARRIVRWCFQYLVVHDFLVHLIPEQVAQELFPDLGADDGTLRALAGRNARRYFEPRLYRPRSAAFVPVEFSVAAYRFGHSLVNPKYTLSDESGERPIFDEEGNDLRGGSALPGGLVIDWARFFPDAEGAGELQNARKLDTRIAKPLLGLPFITPDKDAIEPGTQADEIQQSLAFRNVMRGVALGLPSGQAVARALGAERELANPQIHPELEAPAWRGEAPLWLYVLGEAASEDEQVGGQGEQLGYVGATIVAETLLGMLARDRQSYWNVHPRWTPARELDGALVDDDGEFTVGQLLRARSTLVD